MRLRLATSQDAAAIHGIYAPVVRDTVISFELEPPTEAELARRITTTLETFPWLVAEESGSVRGYAYASRHRDRAAYGWSVDLAVYIHPDAHRQGVGRSLYQALFPILSRQGVHAVYAGITVPNVASVSLHEAVGLHLVGVYREVGFKFGTWLDVGWWEKQLDGPTRAPQPIIPFPALCLPSLISP
jgi:phosphinothricin acetyltransferase